MLNPGLRAAANGIIAKRVKYRRCADALMISYKWCAPKDINFSREQMEGFILPHLYMLRQGDWPPECPDTGYTGIDTAAIRRQHSGAAPYARACEIAAEVGARLNCCGKYARIIYKLNCEEGNHPDKLAQEFNLHPDDFNELWDKLLHYISGWRRKRVTFKRWLKMLEAARVQRIISSQSI